MGKINLSGADNIRDFGGIKNAAGRRIKDHVFLRSNALNRLTEGDIRILTEEYSLKQIIDLRTDEEISEKPDVTIPGAEWIHLPLFQSSMAGITHEKKNASKEALLHSLPDLADLYTLIVTDGFCTEQLKKIFSVITGKKEGSILWHCTEGKDRCGIVSALFLFLMDADQDTVLEDYLATNQASKPRAEQLYRQTLARGGDLKTAEKIRNLFVARPDYLNAALNAIKQKYGSVSCFAETRLLISPEQKKAMQDRFLL